MSNATCAIKNRSNEEMAARREYGIPRRKGYESYNPDGTIEYNTARYDFCNFAELEEKYQKEFFDDTVAKSSDSEYVEFLQDYFYRKYKGYLLPYNELPLDNPRRLELYNQTALDCGHPEYMVDAKGNPLKIYNNEEPENTGLAIEQKSEEEEQKPSDSGVVDIVDADGNVVAENVGSIKNSEQQKPEAASKKDAKQEPEVKPEETDKTVKQNAIIIDPQKIDSSCGYANDNPDRKDNYAKHNKKLLDMYSTSARKELNKFIQLCKSENRVVRLDNADGLIKATIYAANIPEAADISVISRMIDPGKIRNGFYVLTEDAGMIERRQINPFCAVGIKFDDPCLKDYLFRNISDADKARLITDSSIGSSFYRYISYNAFDNDEIKFAINSTYALCMRLSKLNMNVRFKVLNKQSATEFDLVITENVGLGLYAPDNNNLKGLTVNVKCDDANTTVCYTATGDHAAEFANYINSIETPIMHIAFDDVKLTPEQSDAVKEAIDNTINAAEKVLKDEKVKADAKKIDPANNKKSKQVASIPAGRK